MKALVFAAFCILSAPAPVDEIRDARCGSNCLYTAMVALDADEGASLASVERDLGPVATGGYSLGQLSDVAKQRGLQCLVVETTVERLVARQERFACIAHVNGDHFVIIDDWNGESASIVDPPFSERWDRDVLDSSWDGVALLLSTQPLESEEDVAERVRFRVFLRRAGYVTAGFAAIGLAWAGVRYYRVSRRRGR